MKRSILSVLVVLLLFLASCKVSINTLDAKNKAEPQAQFVKITDYEFYAHKEPENYGFKAADAVGLVENESDVVVLDVQRGRILNDYGTMRNFNYKHTVVSNKNEAHVLTEFNRGYDVYHFMNTVEYWLLNGTTAICGYRKTDVNKEVPDEGLNSIGFKACADEFLYNIMPKGWKWEYTHYSYIKPPTMYENTTVIYTRVISGYFSDDTLKVEMTPSGEVCSFEGFGRKKYDVLQNTVSEVTLRSAEEKLDEFLNTDKFKGYNKTVAYVVTDNMGDLYLKKELEDSQGQYFNTFFIKIPVRVLEMSDDYIDMVEENYKINKSLDAHPETTTKNLIINDQNGENISKFKYGVFSADYNSCGAIAVHNSKVLLGYKSTLSETIYDIQKTAGLTLGGVFGSNSDMVPDIMAKYGIKCTEVNANETKTQGVYIVSFWQNNPPWNGTHTIAVKTFSGKQVAYNLYGDGSTYDIDISSYGSKIISCYKVG